MSGSRSLKLSQAAFVALAGASMAGCSSDLGRFGEVPYTAGTANQQAILGTPQYAPQPNYAPPPPDQTGSIQPGYSTAPLPPAPIYGQQQPYPPQPVYQPPAPVAQYQPPVYQQPRPQPVYAPPQVAQPVYPSPNTQTLAPLKTAQAAPVAGPRVNAVPPPAPPR
eukprot:gene15591-20663_t